MNGEWIYIEIARWISSFIFAYIGYLFGIRSQKIQALREYITEIVKDEYPILFSEIKRNSEYLDNYMKKPNIAFTFPKLNNIFDRGLDQFMERHHKDLFLTVNFFQRKGVLKIKEFDLLTIRTQKKIFDSWSNYLKSSLPISKSDSDSIISELVSFGSPYYTFPDLLNERYKEAQNKIERCILYWTGKGQPEINLDEISQSLIERAKPEITNLIEAYKELKKYNDKEVKEKLLPLLQKYISNPI